MTDADSGPAIATNTTAQTEHDATNAALGSQAPKDTLRIELDRLQTIVTELTGRIQAIEAAHAQIRAEFLEKADGLAAQLAAGINDIKANQTHRLLASANEQGATPIGRVAALECAMRCLDPNFKAACDSPAAVEPSATAPGIDTTEPATEPATPPAE